MNSTKRGLLRVEVVADLPVLWATLQRLELPVTPDRHFPAPINWRRPLPQPCPALGCSTPGHPLIKCHVKDSEAFVPAGVVCRGHDPSSGYLPFRIGILKRVGYRPRLSAAMGSVAEHVLRTAPCPVPTVRTRRGFVRRARQKEPCPPVAFSACRAGIKVYGAGERVWSASEVRCGRQVPPQRPQAYQREQGQVGEEQRRQGGGAVDEVVECTR